MLNIPHLPTLPLRRAPRNHAVLLHSATQGMLSLSLVLNLSGDTQNEPRGPTLFSPRASAAMASAEKPAYRWTGYYRTGSSVPIVRDGKAFTQIRYTQEKPVPHLTRQAVFR